MKYMRKYKEENKQGREKGRGWKRTHKIYVVYP